MNLVTMTFDADKWQVVPKKATIGMWAAASECDESEDAEADCNSMYQAMLAAAPQPPAVSLGRESYPLIATVWRRDDEWVLQIEGVINGCSFVCRHTEQTNIPPEEVAGLPSHYAAPQPPAVSAEPDGWIVCYQGGCASPFAVFSEHEAREHETNRAAVSPFYYAPPNADEKCHNDGGSCGAGGYCDDCHTPSADVKDTETANRIRKFCKKCGGEGWLWSYELDNPSEEAIGDDMTRYSCDGEVCTAIAAAMQKGCE